MVPAVCAEPSRQRRTVAQGSIMPHARANSSLGGKQVGSHAPRTLDLLLFAPLGDRRVVSAQEHGRYLAAAPGGRLGVARVLEQTIFVRLFDQAFGVAYDTGKQPANGFDHRQHRHVR